MSEPVRSIAANFSELTITSSAYSSKSPAEARADIKKILDLMTFGVNVEPISLQRAARPNQGDFSGDSVTSKVAVQGVAWVTGNVDGTDNTGKIAYGRPVVFDTTTGRCVTGVNPKWSPTEYKVVGLALASLDSGRERIPVMLGVTSPNDNFAILGKCKPKSNPYPSIQVWSSATITSSNQLAIWEFQLPLSHEFSESTLSQWLKDSSTAGESHWQGADAYVRAFNLDRTYVYKNSFCLLQNAGKGGKLQFYFNFGMSPNIFGTLDADLKKDDKALISIDSDFLGGLEGSKVLVHDKLLVTGKKLKSGNKVQAGLTRKAGTSDTDSNDPYVWQYYVTSSDKCPVKDA